MNSDKWLDELDTVDGRGYRHDKAVTERLSLIAGILINILGLLETTDSTDGEHK